MKTLINNVTAIALLSAMAAMPVLAQNAEGEQAEAIEEIVIVGTRTRPRTVTDSPLAVDVIPTDALERSGFMETARLLQQLAPSFNFGNNTISDGSDVARPATLRGLGPDQVLVLVNGKRHVGQAWLNIGGSSGRGSTGVDLNSIPTHAIERIEILRDGASSQYGSDAISGVINLVLKQQPEGGEVRGVWGQHYDGDGAAYTVAYNQGFAIADGGFFNFTAERRERNATNRADVSNRTFAFPGAEPTAGQRIFRVGDAELENWTVLGNAAIPLGEDLEFYAAGKFFSREGESTGFYRHPHQADRSVPQVFPDGFLPLLDTRVKDIFAIGGVRWEHDSGWHADASVNFGENRFRFGASNTINASIAAEFLEANPDASDDQIRANAGPTSGASGGMALEQVIVNVDAHGPIDLGLPRPLHVAFGFEYRDEKYTLSSGDLESFSCGLIPGPADFPSVVDPAETANCGFQAFPGLAPEVAGSRKRDNYAFYLDLDYDVMDAWLLTGAVRFEDFSGIGSEVTGKIATRVEPVPGLAFRGNFSTGFRAASLPQEGFTSIVTQAGPGGLAQTLIANLDDPFTQAMGIDALDFETSRNFALGFVWDALPDFTLTVDGYRIDIDDRIVFSDLLSVPLLEANNFTAAADILRVRNIDQASVFFNAIDTRTHGVDVVATYTLAVADGMLTSTLAGTYNETEVRDINAPGTIDGDAFFGPLARNFVEDIQPNTRVTLALDFERDRLGAIFRTRYFGSTESRFFTAASIFGCPDDEPCGPVAPFGLDPSATQKVSDAFLFDLEVSYAVTDTFSFAAGANNIFDKKPNKIPDNAVIRWISDGGGFGGPDNSSFGNFNFPLRGVPYGINGGFYYLRTSMTF